MSIYNVLCFCVLLTVCSAQLQWRIVNGTDAQEGEIPYIVSIQVDNQHGCGGSILDATHILTAAHCVYKRENYPFTIQYGVLDVTHDNSNRIKVSSLVWHDKYVPSNPYPNDIAILTLQSPIQFSDNVRPVLLPEPRAPTPAEQGAVLAGWGYQQSGGSVQEHLKRVDIKIYSDEDCEIAHSYKTDREYHICSGLPQGGKGQCSGDSGGPLNVDGVQVGIVSWSKKPCGIAGYPGVFTNVANYIDWIHDNVE